MSVHPHKPLLLALTLCFPLAGLPHASEQVVPEAEFERAKQLQAKGPQETKGIASVKALGAVSLAKELEGAAQDRQLRARELVIEPGGVVAVHEHHRRPGVAVILEGEMMEFRSDAPEGVLRKAGDAAFEYSGLVHWWENRSDQPARALVVDIVPRP